MDKINQLNDQLSNIINANIKELPISIISMSLQNALYQLQIAQLSQKVNEQNEIINKMNELENKNNKEKDEEINS